MGLVRTTLDRSGECGETPPIAGERLVNVDRVAIGECARVRQAEPLEYKRNESEVEFGPRPAPVREPERVLRLAPVLRGEGSAPFVKEREFFRGERDAVGKGVERGQDVGGGELHR